MGFELGCKLRVTSCSFLLGLVLFVFVACAPENKTETVYNSDDLKIIALSSSVYIHESYLETEDFGSVSCNGLIYVSGNEAIIFDTPTGEKPSVQLINWLTDRLSVSYKVVVPTHFHNDCLGGLEAFHEAGVTSIANKQTVDLARERHENVPQYGFEHDTTLLFAGSKVQVFYPGQGHTRDNVVGYVESENTLFGGCLIKALGAQKGYTGDANVSEWSKTVSNVKSEFPQASIIVPGHGQYGDGNLLDYTIELFGNEQ